MRTLPCTSGGAHLDGCERLALGDRATEAVCSSEIVGGSLRVSESVLESLRESESDERAFKWGRE